MALRRGFKKEAKEIAVEAREELKIELFEPIDPYALADLYGVQVCDLTHPDLPPAAVEYYTKVKAGVFSAVLIPSGSERTIIENNTHDILRRRSTIAHEMSHVLLEHEFSLLLAIDNECRSSSCTIEQEAAELSGELLIPWEAARIAAFKKWSDYQVADYFQVSLPMARWRMNATGVRKMFSRWTRKARR
jgi:uncharacterized protein DUF955